MLKGKTVVLTYFISEIEKNVVMNFIENGAKVIICGNNNSNSLENEHLQFQKDDRNVIPIHCDMSKNDSIQTALEGILSLSIPIDGVVNIAGINRDALFGMISYQDIIDTFQVNCFSQILFSQNIAKLMIRQKRGGSIAFTSSITALDGNRGQVTYGASKAALIGAMKSMALELGEHAIRVNCIAPGVIKTPMTEKLPSEIIDAKIKTMDIPRLGEAEEVANAFLWLMSDLSSHITGQVIRVDGGIRS